VINRPNELIEFAIKAITEGFDAVAEVTVRIRALGAPETGAGRRGPQVYSGYSINTDTIVAAAEAYMGALNKLLAAREQRIKAERAAYAAGYDQSAPSYAVDPFGNSVLGKSE
jgi:2-isopropylmalate synthase